jgi:hypothetical protein
VGAIHEPALTDTATFDRNRDSDGDDSATQTGHRRPRPTATLAERLRPESSRAGGLIWLVFMVGMWIAFFATLFADQLDAVSRWVRDLPLLAELVLWLLAFPWLLGTAVWESSWALLVRALLVAAFAIGWTLISLPRTRQ